MPRDYKKKSKRKPARRRKRKQSGHWLWLLSGLIIGLAGAGSAWYVSLESGERSSVHIATDIAPASGKDRADKNNTAAVASSASSEREESQYDFYTLLPKMEVRVPDESIRDGDSDQSREPRHLYILQAGSFRHSKDAEGLKARLALLGVESTVQSVVINDDTWHRVRIGPFRTWQEVRPPRRVLKRHNIHFALLKVKP